jgi:hypothetical protein
LIRFISYFFLKVKIEKNCARTVTGVPLLPPQQVDRQPARWIHVNLSGTTAETTTIFMRDDNMYMVGFTNCTGHEYVFSNRKNLMPAATVIPLQDNEDALQVSGGQARCAPSRPFPSISYSNHFHSQGSTRRILRKIISNDSRGFTVQADRWHGEPGWERQTHIDDLEADRLVLWGKTSYAQKTRRWEDSSQ